MCAFKAIGSTKNDSALMVIPNPFDISPSLSAVTCMMSHKISEKTNHHLNLASVRSLYSISYMYGNSHELLALELWSRLPVGRHTKRTLG